MSIIAKPIPTENPSGALIGYNNLLVTATNDDGSKALIPNTWEKWFGTVGGTTMKFQLASSSDIDFVGIASHNLSSGAFKITVSTAVTVGGALTIVDEINPLDNSPIMLTFDTRTVEEVVVVLSTSSAQIGVVYAGKALQMQRDIYGGHSPITLSAQTKYQSNISDTGQFLGRNIVSQGSEANFSWRLLDPDWYRENFQPFVVSARTKPFFMLWRPDMYASEIAFGQTTSDIKPTNMGGGHGRMSVSFNMSAHNDL